jgi:hypothetical protein
MAQALVVNGVHARGEVKMVSDGGQLSRTEAAISGQLPANNEAATKLLNAVVDVTEAVRALDPLERQKVLGIFGELLLTVQTDDDLDAVYGLLDRLLQERRAGPAKSLSTVRPDSPAGPSSRRTTKNQG